MIPELMATKEQFQELLQPLLDALAGMDPNDPGVADQLTERFPIDDPAIQKLAEAFAEGVSAGWLCDRQGGPGVTYSRVRKARSDGAPSDRLSVDAVRMDRAGPGHTHPNGEFDLCFAVAGAPRFDDQAPGWTVYPAGSWHVPTVSGGTMNILYFLPDGAIKFGPRSE